MDTSNASATALLPARMDTGYPARMAKDTHTTVRAVRIDDTLWLPFGRLVGARGRAEVLKQFIRWYIHEAGAELPERPELRRSSPPAST